MFLHGRGRTAAHAALVAALTASLLGPSASAHAEPSAPAADASEGGEGSDATANDGGGDGRITFGLSTASGDQMDERGFIAVNAPKGAVLLDKVAVVNLSDAALDVDLYAADVTNAADGTLSVAQRDETSELAGSWLKADIATVHVPPQSSSGPGVAIVPVTISIPADAEPGDHLGAMLSSVTATGRSGEDAPAVNLEHRVGLRFYVTVQGLIRPGLTVTDVHATWLPGSVLGPGRMEVSYVLTNSGNVRFGVQSAVRGTGPFGLAGRSADGTKIDELLPHSSVQQSVTLGAVWPLAVETVTVSATAIPGFGAVDPGIGTVTASAWTWLWSWLYLLVLLAIAGIVAWQFRRRRAKRPGSFGPPRGLWENSSGGDGPRHDSVGTRGDGNERRREPHRSARDGGETEDGPQPDESEPSRQPVP